MRAPAILCCLSLAAAAPCAAQTFADDVESGTLLKTDVPAGAWSYDYVGAGNARAATAQAAHRGAYGIRFTDGHSSTTPGSEVGLYASLASPVAPNAYFRFWFRVASSNALGAFEVAMVRINDGQSSDVGNVFWVNDNGGELRFGGRDAAHTWIGEASAAAGAANTAWHLVEVYTTGIGSSNGRRRYFVDGAMQADRSAIDWSGVGADSLVIGPEWSDDPSFLGKLDYDDLRLTTAEPASTLVVSAPAFAMEGDCVQLGASLKSSAGATGRSAPYAFDVTLAAVGVTGAFFSDATCTTSASGPHFTAGATSASAYFKPTSAGTASITAAHLDFLSSSAVSVAVSAAPPDAGAMPDAGTSADAGSEDGGSASDAGATGDGGASTDGGFDGGGESLPDAGAANLPVAVVTPAEQTIAASDLATLDGASSTAPAGTFVATWTWRQLEGPAYVELASAKKVELRPTEPGTYAFQLRVTDTLGRVSAPVVARVVVQGDVFHPPDTVGGCGCASARDDAGARSAATVLASLFFALAAGRRRVSVAPQESMRAKGRAG